MPNARPLPLSLMLGACLACALALPLAAAAQASDGADAAFLADNPAARDEFKARVQQHRRELLPLYERRVAEQGQAAADAWLKREAAARARKDARELRQKYAPDAGSGAEG